MAVDFHIDHDVTRALATELAKRSYYAVTAYDLGLAAEHDGVQLMAAAQRSRVLVSHNWRDYRLLHQTWHHWAAVWHVTQQHAGILIIPQRVWDPRTAAAQLDAFVSRGHPLGNTLHRWVQGTGWTVFTLARP